MANNLLNLISNIVDLKSLTRLKDMQENNELKTYTEKVNNATVLTVVKDTFDEYDFLGKYPIYISAKIKLKDILRDIIFFICLLIVKTPINGASSNTSASTSGVIEKFPKFFETLYNIMDKFTFEQNPLSIFLFIFFVLFFIHILKEIYVYGVMRFLISIKGVEKEGVFLGFKRKIVKNSDLSTDSNAESFSYSNSYIIRNIDTKEIVIIDNVPFKIKENGETTWVYSKIGKNITYMQFGKYVVVK